MNDPSDWSPAVDDAEYAEEGTVYEMVKMTVEVVATQTLPTCKQCDEPATHWGLNEAADEIERLAHEVVVLRER